MKQLENFDITTFLAENWQKRAGVFRSVFPDYESPLSPEELAGLSLEENAESRIIIDDDPKWLLECGPFAEDYFQSLENKTWSLLVQAVDHWLPEINDLKQYFQFIPQWRLDDIMISYAPEGGSVGPHFDYYDVFLIQASGQRRWKLGQHCDGKTPLEENCDLKILKTFEQKEEHVLSAGDMLYIPPGIAHWGLSESDDCMTISIGFRAPSNVELIERLLSTGLSELDESCRFTDKSEARANPAEITANDLMQAKQLISQALDDDALLQTFAQIMTEPKYPESFDIWPCESQLLVKRPDARMAYFINNDQLDVYINGHQIKLPLSALALIQKTSISEKIDLNSLDSAELEVITIFIEHGLYEDYEEYPDYQD